MCLSLIILCYACSIIVDAVDAGDGDVAEHVPAAAPPHKKKKTSTKSQAPIWTPKLNAKLTKAINFYAGKASNGGTAWVNVEEEMNITKHHIKKQWKLIGSPPTPPPPSPPLSPLSPLSPPAALPKKRRGRRNSRKVAAAVVDMASDGGDDDDEEEEVAHAASKIAGLKNLFNRQLEEFQAQAQEQLKRALATKDEEMAALMKQPQPPQQKKVKQKKVKQLVNHVDIHSSEESADDSDGEVRRHRERKKSKKPKRTRNRSKKSKEGRQVTENDLMMLQETNSSYQEACSLKKEVFRLRFLNA